MIGLSRWWRHGTQLLAKTAPVLRKKSRYADGQIGALMRDQMMFKGVCLSVLLQSIRIRCSGCAVSRRSMSAVIQQMAPLVSPMPKSRTQLSLLCGQCCDRFCSARRGWCVSVDCTPSWPSTAPSTQRLVLLFILLRWCWISRPLMIRPILPSRSLQSNISGTCRLLLTVVWCLSLCYIVTYLSIPTFSLGFLCLRLT